MHHRHRIVPWDNSFIKRSKFKIRLVLFTNVPLLVGWNFQKKTIAVTLAWNIWHGLYSGLQHLSIHFAEDNAWRKPWTRNQYSALKLDHSRLYVILFGFYCLLLKTIWCFCYRIGPFSTTWHLNESHNFRWCINLKTSQVSFKMITSPTKIRRFHECSLYTKCINLLRFRFVKTCLWGLCISPLCQLWVFVRGEISYFVYSCQANTEY